MPDPVKVDMVLQAVADAFGLTVKDLTGMRRCPHLAVPRQIAYALARKYTKLSYPQIGERIGDRDHTTIIHGVRKVHAGNFAHEAERIERAEALIEGRRRAVFYRHSAFIFQTSRGQAA